MNIPYAKHEITAEDIAAVTEVLQEGALTNGSHIAGFEDAFATTFQAERAVGVANGTAALHLAVHALGIAEGQTVIVPSLTFAATANSVLYNGGNVAFVDIDPDTLLLNIDQVADKVARDPKQYAGVIAVDFAGYPVDTKTLSDICKDHDMWLIEDAAHAPGAISHRHAEEVIVGSSDYADATTFSFHPAKHITAGEGGMVTTSNAQRADTIQLLRSHGMGKTNEQAQKEGWYYRIDELGFNYRLSDINAALGHSQLDRLGGNLALRQEIANNYRAAFEDTVIDMPEYDEAQVHANHLFVVRVPERKRVYEVLKGKGIFTQVLYIPLHTQPLYRRVAGEHALPHTEKYYEECLSLPMYPSLSADEQAYVIDALTAAVD